MTSEIDKLKLAGYGNGEGGPNGGFVGNLGLSKKTMEKIY